MNPWLGAGSLALPTYFTLLMVGLSVGIVSVRREAVRQGVDPRIALDAVLVLLPAAIVGSRVAHVLIEAPGYYADHPLDVFAPDGGFVFYGGLAGAFAAGWSYARRRGLSFWSLADLFAPGTALGLVFGRLGCLGAGCCYGRPADWPFGWAVPWAVTYVRRGKVADELLGVPLHPAPLYEAVGCLALFVGLCAVAARRRFPGQVLLALVAGYGVLRPLVEAFRADAERGLWLGGRVSTSQLIGVLSVVAASLLYRWRSRACTPSCSPSAASTSTRTG